MFCHISKLIIIIDQLKFNEHSCSASPAMALQVTYRYRQTKDEVRRKEGLEVKRRYPNRVPVRADNEQ